MVGIGIVGYGYWGPNLARNFSSAAGGQLIGICDQRAQRLEAAARSYPSCKVTSRFDELLANPAIHAVAICTPGSTHFTLAQRAILAGKDVLVEKPMTTTTEEARQLIDLARQHRRILGVDHTFLYAEAVQKIKSLIQSGEIGQVLYIDSVRTNLGLFQPDHNVIYDLAPHELSMLDYWLEQDPVSIQSLGACHAGNGIENLAYVHCEYERNLIAHFHFNWLSPVKIRRTIIAGTRKMIVYDDLERIEKIRIYDKGIAFGLKEGLEAQVKASVNYRMGDMVVPHLENRESLAVEASHFIECVRERRAPLANGEAGLRVVRVLEAAQQSLRLGGQRVKLPSEHVVSLPAPCRQVA